MNILEIVVLFFEKQGISSKVFIELFFSLIFAYVIYLFIYYTIKNALLFKSKTEKQRKNVILFLHLIKYLFVIVYFLIIISVLTGSFASLGVSAGLMTAALGWALQRPITGIAAWIMILIKKPFQIGDRISVGDTKGDVIDVSLTHVSLGEIGGTVASEESSGRTILIPNSILFEQKIINYTMQDEYILDEAFIIVTYESNLEKAKEICYECALEYLDENIKNKPFVRIFFQDSGINIKVRYRVKASKRIEVLSNINNKIISKISKESDINIGYPHIQLVDNYKRN